MHSLYGAAPGSGADPGQDPSQQGAVFSMAGMHAGLAGMQGMAAAAAQGTYGGAGPGQASLMSAAGQATGLTPSSVESHTSSYFGGSYHESLQQGGHYGGALQLGAGAGAMGMLGQASMVGGMGMPQLPTASLMGPQSQHAGLGAGHWDSQSLGSASAAAGTRLTRTLFIKGPKPACPVTAPNPAPRFPQDVKDRELHNLARLLPGYQASQLSFKAGSAQGFALFASPLHASAALDILSGLQFDGGCVLRCELAHKDMYIKEGDPSIKLATPLSSRHVALLQNTPHLVLQPMPVGPATSTAAAYSSLGLPPELLGLSLGAGAQAFGDPGLAAAPMGFAPVTNTGDNPPCNTLFIGNLGAAVSEDEVRALFGNQPGFKQFKLVKANNQVNCFVEYENVQLASEVHMALQGAILATSDRGGIRVQFSKNPLGRR